MEEVSPGVFLHLTWGSSHQDPSFLDRQQKELKLERRNGDFFLSTCLLPRGLQMMTLRSQPTGKLQSAGFSSYYLADA